MLNSKQHETYLAHRCLNANNDWHFNNIIMGKIDTDFGKLEQETCC